MCTVYGPIFHAFEVACDNSETYFRLFAEQVAKSAYLVGRSFKAIAQDGFCGPQPPQEQPNESTETTEGTGLADGQGNEDITKDIEDDEDMGDLDNSGEPQDKDEAGDTEAKELDDDVGGDLESVAGENSDEEGSQDEDEADLDEEVGTMDDADPTAVDEKMWDEEEDNSARDK
ncbi:hypothetical protein BCR37DRAFT_346137, partial [Protomyces lactucae-debilis]